MLVPVRLPTPDLRMNVQVLIIAGYLVMVINLFPGSWIRCAGINKLLDICRILMSI